MALIGLVLVALTIIFFTIFSTPQFWQSEMFQLISGFMEVLIINFMLIILLLLLGSLFPSSSGAIFTYGFGGLGLLQLLYVVPRSLYLRRRQRWARLKGVIGAAVIVALLSGGCWIFMMGGGGV